MTAQDVEMMLMVEAVQDEYLAATIEPHVLERADDAYIEGRYYDLRAIYSEFVPDAMGLWHLSQEAERRLVQMREDSAQAKKREKRA